MPTTAAITQAASTGRMHRRPRSEAQRQHSARPASYLPRNAPRIQQLPNSPLVATWGGHWATPALAAVGYGSRSDKQFRLPRRTRIRASTALRPATIPEAPAETRLEMYRSSRAATGMTSTEASTAGCVKAIQYGYAVRNRLVWRWRHRRQGHRQHVLDVVPLLPAVN